MEDVRSLLSLNKNYLSVEPFIPGVYDLRIQKIGPKFRVFKRVSLSGSWKTNTGTSSLEELEMTDRYRFWITEASKMFGGLDICTVDVIRDADSDKEFIMEVNGSSSGFSPDSDTLEADNIAVKELVMSKLNSLQYLS
jgi:glutathione synthase/RimK-type ligase-like ATP-grasp enzyme